MPIAVAISIVGRSIKVDSRLMRKAVRIILAGEGITSADISLAFVDDATSARINKTYLRHTGPTDVITFPLSKSKAKKLEGELVIGSEVAKRVAAERRHDVQAELALYVIHGLLHLCGYDDKQKAVRTKMQTQQRHYLKMLGLPAISD